MRIGAHVPVRRGILSAIPAARERGAEAVQVFVSNPRAWAPPRPPGPDAEAFREAWAGSGLGPLFVHAPYLVNIASPDPAVLARSRTLLAATVRVSAAYGADAVVVHAGAGRHGEPRAALRRAAATLRVAGRLAAATAVAVELSAGTAGAVASTFAEAARLFDAAGDDRLRLCVDTCHLFAAGYALDRPEGVEACFEELRAAGLADRLVLVHANDARYPRGSRRDRHEHVGRGFIGREGFRAILARPELAELAVVVETAGDARAHRRDIETLRRLAGRSSRVD
jgi:deoxyribonuclease-4